MALDETAHAALRALRTQSTPKGEDRARIKAKLLLSLAPLSNLVASSTSAATTTANAALGGAGPTAIPLVPTVGASVTSGGLVGAIGAKVGAVGLCVLVGAIGLAGVARWGSSSPTPVANSAAPRTTVSSVADGERVVPTVASHDASLSEPSAAVEIPVQPGANVMPSVLRRSTGAHPTDARSTGARPIGARSTDARPIGARSTGARPTDARSTAEDSKARKALQSEIGALRAAQEALRDGDPDAALRHLEKQERGSQLARDREGLRAVALCDANQREAGRKAAEQFLSRYASSALARRVRSACAKFLVSPGATEVSH